MRTRSKFLTINARDASTLAGIAAFGDDFPRKRLSNDARQIARVLLNPNTKRGSKIVHETAAAMRAYMTPT